MAVSVKEFAAAVREKSGSYHDVPDDELTRAMIKKYPVYADAVDTSEFTQYEETKERASPIDRIIDSVVGAFSGKSEAETEQPTGAAMGDLDWSAGIEAPQLSMPQMPDPQTPPLEMPAFGSGAPPDASAQPIVIPDLPRPEFRKEELKAPPSLDEPRMTKEAAEQLYKDRQWYNALTPDQKRLYKDRGIVSITNAERIGKAAARAVWGMAQGAGGMMQAVGAEESGKELAKMASSVMQNEAWTPDPNLVDMVSSAAASTAVMWLPGAGLSKLATVVGAAKAAPTIGATASGFFEASVEAGQAYEQTLALGYDKNQAQQNAAFSFFANIGPNALLNRWMFPGSPAESTLKQMIGSGKKEVIQENWQNAVAGFVEGEAPTLKEIGETALVSFVTAAGMSPLMSGSSEQVEMPGWREGWRKELEGRKMPTLPEAEQVEMPGPEDPGDPGAAAAPVAPLPEPPVSPSAPAAAAEMVEPSDAPVADLTPPAVVEDAVQEPEEKPVRGIDPLYMIQNRAAFDEDLSDALSAAEESGEDMAVAFLDTQNQDQLNKQIGHEETDKLLRRIGEIEDKHIKALNDQGIQAERYRTGGDERGVIARGMNKDELSEALAPMVEEIDAFISKTRIRNTEGHEIGLSELWHSKHQDLVTGAGQVNLGTADLSDIKPDSPQPVIDMLQSADKRAGAMSTYRMWRAIEGAQDKGVAKKQQYLYNRSTSRFVHEPSLIGKIIEGHREDWADTDSWSELRARAVQEINRSGLYERIRPGSEPNDSGVGEGDGRSGRRVREETLSEGDAEIIRSTGFLSEEVQSFLRSEEEAYESSSLEEQDEGVAERKREEYQLAQQLYHQKEEVRKTLGLEPDDEQYGYIFRGQNRDSDRNPIRLSDENTSKLERMATWYNTEEGRAWVANQGLMFEIPQNANDIVALVQSAPQTPVELAKLSPKTQEKPAKKKAVKKKAVKKSTPQVEPEFSDQTGDLLGRSEGEQRIAEEKQKKQDAKDQKRRQNPFEGLPLLDKNEQEARATKQEDLFAGRMPESEETLPPEMRDDPLNPTDPLDIPTSAPRTVPLSMEALLDPESKPQGAQDILDDMADFTQTPVYVGKLSNRQVAGQYHPIGEYARIRSAGNLVQGVHELGHALMRQLLRTDYGQRALRAAQADPDMAVELYELANEIYNGHPPSGQEFAEGFADWVFQSLVTDETTARAPRFTEHFEREVIGKMPIKKREQWESLKQKVRTYREQGPEARIASMVERGQTRPSSWRKVRDIFGKDFVKEWLDELDILHQFDNAVTKAGGPNYTTPDIMEMGPIGESVGLLAETLKYTHHARARYMANQGMINFAGNHVGRPLKDYTSMIRPSERVPFTVYMVARRARNLHRRGLETGVSEADVDAVLGRVADEVGGIPDRWQMAAEGIYEWQRGLLQYLTQADPNLEPMVERMLAASGDYVPFSRIMPEGFKAYGSGEGGASGLMMFKGSAYRIRDPFQVMLEQAESLIKLSHQKRIMKNILTYKDMPGIAGKFIRQVPPHMVPTSVDLETVQRKINDLLQEAGGENIDLGAQDVDMDELITFFTPAKAGKNGDPIMPVVEDGTIRWYEMNPELYKTLNNLDIYRLNPVADLLLAAPVRMFKLGTTGARATFAYARNPSRDIQSLFMQTQSGVNSPFTLAMHWAKNMARSASDGIVGYGGTEYAELWKALGGDASQFLGQDTRQVRRATKELFGGLKPRVVTNPIDYLRDVLQFPEQATRVTEIEMIAKRLGWKPGDVLTEDMALKMLLAGRRSTTDFGQAGRIAKVINQMYPFFNANVQGTRTFVRAYRRDPMGVTLKGLAGITIPTLLLWNKNKDKEWWRELPWREKFGYWHIESGDEVIRIPRAHEIGNMFATMPEAVMQSMYEEDPKAVMKAFGHIFETTSPTSSIVDLVPHTAKPIAEQLANRSFFYDKPIVPMGERSGPYDEQFGPYTSKVAIAFGDIGRKFGLPISPRRVDHLIAGYFGGLGRDIASLGGTMLPTGLRPKEPADYPIIGTFFRRGGIDRGTRQTIDDLYNEYAKLKRESSSRDYGRKYNAETVRRYERAHSAIQVVGLFGDIMSDENILKNMLEPGALKESGATLKQVQSHFSQAMNEVATNALVDLGLRKKPTEQQQQRTAYLSKRLADNDATTYRQMRMTWEGLKTKGYKKSFDDFRKLYESAAAGKRNLAEVAR